MIKSKSNTQPRIKAEFKIYLLFVILGFILYGNTIKHDYALDDAIAITKNVFTQQGLQGVDELFKYDSFVGFWLSSYPDRTAEQIQQDKKLVAGGRYRPLSFVSFAVENQFFGNNPGVSHFVNIILYILTGIMLYHFLVLLFPFGSKQFAWFSLPVLSVLLFLTHPIHTEVVANIKGRDELLSFLGAVIAGWAYIKYIQESKLKFLVFAFFSMFFALLSKENAVTWLAVIPLSAWFFLERNIKAHIAPMFSLIIPTVVFLLIRQSVLGWGATGEAHIAQELMNNPFIEAEGTERFGTILFTLWMYLRLLIFPHPLTYDYYPYHIPLMSINELLPLAMIVVYSVFFILVLMVIRRHYFQKSNQNQRVLALSILMYLAPLSVVSNVFFPVGVFMAERFVYYSSLGFVIFLAWVVIKLFKKNTYQNTGLSIVGLSVVILLMSAYSFKTIHRNKVWENDFVLFTTDVKTSVNSAKANTTAGGKLLEKSKEILNKNHPDYNPQLAAEYLDLSIKYLNRAIQIHPTYTDPMLLLGNAYYENNRDIANSVKQYANILRIRPAHVLAEKNAALVLRQTVSIFDQGKAVNSPDEIIEACKYLDKIKPGIPEVYRIIGLMYARYKQDFKTAIPYYEKAKQINPDDIEIWKDLGVIYGQSGMYEEALESFVKVHELDKSDARAVFNLAVTYQNLGNKEKATEYFSMYNMMSQNEAKD
jgi:protein O-mannosyl-transferase